MHQVLHIPEILLSIFGHCTAKYGWRSSVDLAVLARTCRTFKEPALDLLWEELYDLSPLARCLPEACDSSWGNGHCYAFSRPLNEAEWISLRGYTRRVRLMFIFSSEITEETIRVIFSLAPFDEPPFPHLQSFYWNDTATFSLPHVAVPSLKALHLYLNHMPLQTFKEFLDAFADRCPHMESLGVEHDDLSPEDSTISDLVCRWPKLQEVACPDVALNTNTISQLSSLSSLKSLRFKAGTILIQDISHLDSKLVFSTLTFLNIKSEFIDTLTLLLHHIRLPAIEALSVVAEGYISRLAIQSYWAAVQEACPSNVLAHLTLHCSGVMDDVPDNEELFPCLTLDDLRPCTFFTNLRGLDVDFRCPVSLTDADLLEIMSPGMEYLFINSERGWQIDADSGGITLSGLVRLLQKCPSLNYLCIAIDTRTFCEIPGGLDVSFPARRELDVDVLDSYILPELGVNVYNARTVCFHAFGLVSQSERSAMAACV